MNEPLSVTTDAKIKSAFYKAQQKYTQGIYSDDTSWKPVQDLMRDLKAILPTFGLVYTEDDVQRPRNYKKWHCAGSFTTPAGVQRAVVGHITASGAGSVEDPLDKFDVTFTHEVMSPKTVTDEKIKEYLKADGLNVRDEPMSMTAALDKIASHLESLGMIKEAHDLDVVSNTIEAAFSTCASSYDKYLLSTPADGGEYYSLDIPEDKTPPKEGESFKLGDVDVVVFSVSTPKNIAKGRGGPVARSMRHNGIGWRVNCLPKGHKYFDRMAKDTFPIEHRFFTYDELKKKGEEHAEKFYQEYVHSAQGKKVYDKALKAHPDYNKDKDEAQAATKMILEDVGKWLEEKGRPEGEVNLLKDSLSDKIIAGLT